MSEIMPIIIKSVQSGVPEGMHMFAVCIKNATVQLWAAYHTQIIWVVVLFLFCRFLEKGIGSVLYNVVFFSISGLIIAIFGWDIIFNDLFGLIMFVNYKFSYWAVGSILRSIGHWTY